MTKKGHRKNNFPGEIEMFLIISVFSYNGTFRDFFKSGPGFWHLENGISHWSCSKASKALYVWPSTSWKVVSLSLEKTT